MPRNTVQFRKGLSEPEFERLYGTEDKCRAQLLAWRWPGGFECPACGGRAHCVVKQEGRELYQCNACRTQTSLISGTIFASTKLELMVWFRAMYLMTQTKQGISRLEQSRRLGVSYNTAWMIHHKLAQVMMERDRKKPLDGRVEMDTNPVENTIRPITLNRKNALFAPSRDFGHAKTLPGNGPRRGRPHLGAHGVADRNLQIEQHRSIRLSACHNCGRRQPAPQVADR